MVQSQGEVPGAASVAPQAGVGGGRAGGVPVLEPVARLELPTTASGQVIFGSVEVDGANRLVYVRHPDVSGWLDRVSWYAPEAALVGIFVALVAVVAALLRMRRWPRRAGRVYCAACNYELDGVEVGGRCPECGVPEARRVKGRGGLRRFGPVLAIAAVVMVVGVGVLVTRIERATGAMVTGLEWPVPALGRWVPALRLVKGEEGFGRSGQVLVYSIDAGERVATPLVRRSGMIFDLVASADGGAAAVAVFELGVDGAYRLYVVPVEGSVPHARPGDAQELESLGASGGQTVGVGLEPVLLSSLLSDGSRWLYFSRSWLPLSPAAARLVTELARVRVREGVREGEVVVVARYESPIASSSSGVREAPYHRWLACEEDPTRPEQTGVPVALFLDHGQNATDAAAGVREATVVAFSRRGSEAPDAPEETSRSITVKYTGTSFYPARLSQKGGVVEFEPYGGSGTVLVDLESGTTTLLATGVQGQVLAVEHLGWRFVPGRSVVGPDGATIAVLGGAWMMSSPNAVSQDGRYATGFNHSVTGVGWWNELGIGPWNQGEVLVWDLSQVPGWRGR